MKLCPICATSYSSEHRTCPTHGALLVETPELPPGTIIRDCYRIEKVLGRGGMGTVYLAEHTLMSEPRALKFLSGSLASNPTFVQRFLQEARAANKLRHPNIAQTLELGQTEDGSFYISMEYVDGPSLRSLLEQAPQGLPPERAFAIVRGVAEGLGAAHAKHIVHRDIKPENILLAWANDTETAKVVDFGIVAMSDSVGRLTQAGQPLLTAEYAAPEQWRGTITPAEMDGRTDIYALGCMFFETLTGRLPFFSETYEGWFEQHVHVAPPAPSSVRPELAQYPGLDALVLRMLAKDRENRPATVWEFLTELDKAAVPMPPAAVPVYGAPPPPPPGIGMGTGQFQSGAGFRSGTGRPQTMIEVPGSSFTAEPAWNPVQPPPLPNAPFVSGPYTPGPTGTTPLSEWNGGQTGFPPANLPNAFPPNHLPPGNLPQTKASGLSRTQGMVIAFLAVLVLVVAVVIVAGKFLGKSNTAHDNPPVEPIPTPAPTPVPGPAVGPQPVPQPVPQPFPQPGLKPHPGVQPATDTATTARQAVALYQKRQYAQALPLFNDACNKGDADSCEYMGWMYQHKLGVEQDYARANALYSKGCAGGSMAGCSNLGVMYQDKLGVEQDYGRAVALYTKACNGNFAAGCDNLGYMYEFEKGVPKDYQRSFALYNKACSGGSLNGCKDLGWMYQNKLGVEQNFSKALELYTRACNGNVLEGCNNLGFMYQHKLGVAQDYAKALELYTKACNGDEAIACNNLGVMYEDKQGVPQDYARAAFLYKKACDGGNGNGCSDLGNLYASGNGVPKDMDKAKALLSKGCTLGNQWGCDRLKKLS